jgi:hypothetical protein
LVSGIVGATARRYCSVAANVASLVARYCQACANRSLPIASRVAHGSEKPCHCRPAAIQTVRAQDRRPPAHRSRTDGRAEDDSQNLAVSTCANKPGSASPRSIGREHVLYPLRDARSIQQVLSMVLAGLMSGRIPTSQAVKMLFALQTASIAPGQTYSESKI